MNSTSAGDRGGRIARVDDGSVLLGSARRTRLHHHRLRRISLLCESGGGDENCENARAD